eukprot:3087738-Alexandrium_andersonii.AAC.1
MRACVRACVHVFPGSLSGHGTLHGAGRCPARARVGLNLGRPRGRRRRWQCEQPSRPCTAEAQFPGHCGSRAAAGGAGGQCAGGRGRQR